MLLDHVKYILVLSTQPENPVCPRRLCYNVSLSFQSKNNTEQTTLHLIRKMVIKWVSPVSAWPCLSIIAPKPSDGIGIFYDPDFWNFVLLSFSYFVLLSFCKVLGSRRIFFAKGFSRSLSEKITQESGLGLANSQIIMVNCWTLLNYFCILSQLCTRLSKPFERLGDFNGYYCHWLSNHATIQMSSFTDVHRLYIYIP